MRTLFVSSFEGLDEVVFDVFKERETFCGCSRLDAIVGCDVECVVAFAFDDSEEEVDVEIDVDSEEADAVVAVVVKRGRKYDMMEYLIYEK
jgi:hypothetical protein